MGPRRYVDESELEELVARRLQERKEFVAEAMEAIKPELTDLRSSIDSANHIKRDLGQQLSDLTNEVRETNGRLTQHIQLKAHPDGQRLIQEFAIDSLSLEEKKALAGVLAEHVQSLNTQRQSQRRSDREMTKWLVIATLIGSIASAVVAVVAVLALEASRHLAGVG